MHEWTIATDTVGEMYDSEGVGKCRVVAHHGGKILSDQKCRAAFNRHGQLGLVVRAREGGAVGARHSAFPPCCIGAVLMVAAMPLRQRDFTTPGFAVAIFAAIDQEAGG